ncbi:MAG: hypothetical protein HOE30_00845 [Deltaproteobacteria bacterium]|nr:hypothetical protein [Deltaproteobacteria bacterium]MBT4362097.1 hypothetical protein [Candidatus Neomarinimicrobiota bacterium]
MNLIRRDDGLALLSRICKASKKVLVLISPWISKRELVHLADLTDPSTKIKIITRWPLPTDSPNYTDVKAIKYALSDDRIELQWSSGEDDLHAKVYFSPEVGALITSANLTGKGFPSVDHPRHANIELGVFVSVGRLLTDVCDWIDNLSTTTAKDNDLKILVEWDNDYRQWAKKLPKVPEPPRPFWNPKSAVVAALESIKGKPGLAKFEHQSIGRGSAAFDLYFNKDSPAYPVRVLTSIMDEQTPYHFDISKNDVDSWHKTRRKRKPGIRGVVLSAVVHDDDHNRVFSNKVIPPVFLPFDYLFSDKHLSIKKFMSKKGARGKSRQVLIERVDNEWMLRCPSLKNGNKRNYIALKPCVGKTTQLRKKESWRIRLQRA